MTHDVNWSPYTGSISYNLAGILLLVTVLLTFIGLRFRQAKPGQGPGKFLSALLIGSWVLSVLTSLTAIIVYGLADFEQGISFTSTNPITPLP